MKTTVLVEVSNVLTSKALITRTVQADSLLEAMVIARALCVEIQKVTKLRDTDLERRVTRV